METNLIVPQRPDQLTVLLDFGDDENLLYAPFCLLAHMLDGRPKTAGEADLIFLADLLFAEVNHTMVQQGLSDDSHGLGRQWMSQLDSADFRGQGTAAGNNQDLFRSVDLGIESRSHISQPGFLRGNQPAALKYP
jgi:hypothetical protein